MLPLNSNLSFFQNKLNPLSMVVTHETSSWPNLDHLSQNTSPAQTSNVVYSVSANNKF